MSQDPKKARTTAPVVVDNVDAESPRPEQLVRPTGALAPVAGSTALVAANAQQKKLRQFLTELDAWLSLPFISPKAIATRLEAAEDGQGEAFFFTLLRHGETEFEREVTDDLGTHTVTEPAHLWLAQAQNDLVYRNNAGTAVTVSAGDHFIISQRAGSRIREKIAAQTTALLDEQPIPNCTIRFAKLSAASAAKGHSRPTTFTVAEDGAVI